MELVYLSNACKYVCNCSLHIRSKLLLLPELVLNVDFRCIFSPNCWLKMLFVLSLTVPHASGLVEAGIVFVSFLFC